MNQPCEKLHLFKRKKYNGTTFFCSFVFFTCNIIYFKNSNLTTIRNSFKYIVIQVKGVKRNPSIPEYVEYLCIVHLEHICSRPT